MPALTLSKDIFVTGPISQLLPLLDSLAWKLTRTLDPAFPVAEETFKAASAHLRLDAFEQYIRGISERDPDERMRHLTKAVELDPHYTAAWLAIGRLQFDTQQYEDAAASFAHIPKGDPAELEASFDRGLAQLFAGSYARAEDAFAGIARVLPLPEVVNNQGVALSRRGKDATALYRQSVAGDPNDADYHFNLALALYRAGNHPEALAELNRCLKLRATDTEASTLSDLWPDGRAPDAEPLDRIKRVYDGAAYRQATLMLEQVQAARLQALPPTQRAASLASSAHDDLDHGLLLESERLYQQALAADANNADAHLGLALVRERTGDSQAARTQAKAAIALHPSVDAWLCVARLDLAANQLPDARQDTTEALKLDPQSRVARDLRKTIDTRLDAATSAARPSAQSQP